MNTAKSRYATALVISIIFNLLLLTGMPVLHQFASPPQQKEIGDPIRLISAMRIKPPPPKKKEVRKKEPPPKVHPKLKQIMPKLDDMSLLDVPFQFDLGLVQGDQEMQLSLGVKIWDEANVDVKPVALFRVKPVYPAGAMSQNINGKVKIKFLVDRDGLVKTAEIIKAEPEGIFEEATTHAIKQWRFQPAKVKGTPVACWCQTSITYELEL
jgi:protein TonB